jgi:excisionase family DNA binding protein
MRNEVKNRKTDLRILKNVEVLQNEFDCTKTSEVQLLFENLKWLTSRETVTYLRLPSLGSLRQLVYRRQIPFHKMGRSLRFNREELDSFLESSKPLRRIA